MGKTPSRIYKKIENILENSHQKKGKNQANLSIERIILSQPSSKIGEEQYELFLLKDPIWNTTRLINLKQLDFNLQLVKSTLVYFFNFLTLIVIERLKNGNVTESQKWEILLKKILKKINDGFCLSLAKKRQFGQLEQYMKSYLFKTDGYEEKIIGIYLSKPGSPSTEQSLKEAVVMLKSKEKVKTGKMLKIFWKNLSKQLKINSQFLRPKLNSNNEFVSQPKVKKKKDIILHFVSMGETAIILFQVKNFDKAQPEKKRKKRASLSVKRYKILNKDNLCPPIAEVNENYSQRTIKIKMQGNDSDSSQEENIKSLGGKFYNSENHFFKAGNRKRKTSENIKDNDVENMSNYSQNNNAIFYQAFLPKEGVNLIEASKEAKSSRIARKVFVMRDTQPHDRGSFLKKLIVFRKSVKF